MIQETFDRISALVSQTDIMVVTNENHSKYVSEQLDIPEGNVILEPLARNTAPAIALGIFGMDEEDVVIVLPSDHYIENTERYLETLNLATGFANGNDAIVTLGIRPDHPETGYGYIEIEKNILDSSERSPSVFPVKRFHEKPNTETAFSYMESGNFFWNSGMFIFKVSSMRNAFRKHMPKMYSAFEDLKKRIHSGRVKKEEIKRLYESLEAVSIDYGVMERADNVFVIPSDFGWNDVGSWDALYGLSEKDGNGNYSDAKTSLFRDSKNCAIFAEGKRIVISHLNDVIVVVDGDDVLVTKRGTTQDVKNISF